MLRRVLLGLTAFAMMGLAAGPAAAAFPDRAVRIIVPFPAGGSNDVIARLIGQRLSEIWKQPVVIENRPGAGGNIGTEAVVRADPDGYTLLVTAPGPLVINPALYANLAFKPLDDLAPVALVANVPIVLAVNPQVGATTVAELIALAKAQPGKLLFGSSGNGTTNHLAGELLKTLAGINIAHVPYRGAAPAMSDLIAGHIPILFDNLPAVRPQVAGGKIRALAVAGAARSPLYPELPTMIEAGVAGFDASAWFGLSAPAKTPPEVMKVLVDTVTTILREPETVAKFAELGAEPGALFGAAFGEYLRTETTKWAGIVRSAAVKVD
ncbi:Bug family tripartite tricarboxylate transporter substrate binding protein [Phreatobacter stygius]|uniref:Tripartite tricarboxylate transporter substrate binding protein n=1 Tax=Phreatobacter stygius TaxID=1940610 RepID=A0A4D7AVC4_9HYPH|nr:tripartite tricarboxylate transporter substrate binding protein [Phreatobacter stygius]QCI62953.1 tripartite tricarboxylate transporter substrate binding protein [Phreatobacter stygius]